MRRSCYQTISFSRWSVLLVCLVSALPAQAAIFDLRTFDSYPEGTIADLEGPSFTISVDGIAATLTANDGFLNQTSSGFGVNATGAGDDTDALDNGSGATEAVAVTFSEDIVLETLELSEFSASDEASLVIGIGSPLSLTAATSQFTSGNLVPAGQSFVIAYANGNGFSFDRFSVVAAPSSVPGLGSWGTAMLLVVTGTIGVMMAHRAQPRVVPILGRADSSLTEGTE